MALARLGVTGEDVYEKAGKAEGMERQKVKESVHGSE